ncbi:choice-of-anchor Q domain-containing protein [Haloferula sp.]|uniref:choice-of-anchor Q domain-containing protein n=1 Tax=Haloferula sp. TaxID=2497595 RepID=UPI00329EE8B3
MTTASSRIRSAAGLTLGLLLGSEASYANINEPPSERTTAPGHEMSCTLCHSSVGGTGNALVTFPAGTANKYEPGAEYSLSVIITDPNLNGRRAGFAMVARDESNDSATVGTVGEWIIAPGDNVKQIGAGEDLQVGHNPASDATEASGTQKTYTVNWKAPAAGVGNVKFYVAAVTAGPNPSLISDDHTYIYEGLTVSEVIPPQTLVVTTADAFGAGSLRQNIADAAAEDTIVFAAALEGMSIGLGGSQILIDKNLTIDASALPGGITLSGEEISRVFEVASGVTVSMESLTITGGDSNNQSGGAILNSGGNLILQNSTVSNSTSGANSGGAIFSNGGSLTLTDSNITGNSNSSSGGGLYYTGAGNIMVRDSTITGNSAGTGGGIYNVSGVLTVDDSTVSGNTATGSGGGILLSSGTTTINNSIISGNTATTNGGGIFTVTGSLTLNQSTISGNATDSRGGGIYSDTNLTGTNTTLSHCTATENTAALGGGAIYNFDGRTIIDHCTIVGNRASVPKGSGILSYGDSATETQVGHTIISANAGSDIDTITGAGSTSFTSNGFNLIGTGESTGAFIQTGDTTGNTNPDLGPLCDNGGQTQTMSPLPGSRAINAGVTTTGLTEDQRGFPRLVGTAVDIGAVESERVSFDLEWSGASFGNNATAIGRITFEPSQLANPTAGNTNLDALMDFTITVSGASSGNGTFSRSNFDIVFWDTGDLPLDFSTELVDQATELDPWGTSQPGNTGGDFNIFSNGTNPSAPNGTYYFELTTAGSEKMLLTSFRPASGPPPAASVVHSPGLTAAFPSRTTLTNAPGESTPAPISQSSNGSAIVWQWTPQVDGWFDINTFGSSFDTRLSVYEGLALSSLVWIAGNDDAYPGEFAIDHPQFDRSAIVIPLSAGKTYQIVIEGGSSGQSGGSLQWSIHSTNEPMPPAMEIRTHFPFNFLPLEYAGGSALIDTIVPVGNFGVEEPYVHVLDTRSSVWNIVTEVDEQVVDDGEVTVRPVLGAGSSIRTSEAAMLSSNHRSSEDLSDRFFPSPTSQVPGPFATVVSARYPHRFGAGHRSICVDFRAEGGQGYGMTHMPRAHLGTPSPIAPGLGGLQVEFQYVGNPPPLAEIGYTLKDAKGNEIDSGMGTNAGKLIPDLPPGAYSISFEAPAGYRIAVARRGEGIPDPERANINLTIPNVIEEGSNLVTRNRSMCIFFPNSVDCTHFSPPNFSPPNFLAASLCEVRPDLVTNIAVEYSELATGKDIVGYINVPDPDKVLDDADLLDSPSNPFVSSTLLNLSHEAQTMVLAMEPDEDADPGRVLRWKKPETGAYSAYWVKWRNFVSLGRNFPPEDPLDPLSESLCFQCHTREFDQPPNTEDPVDGLIKPGGGEPRVPWFKPVGGPREEPIEDRLEVMEPEPFTLAILNRPFDNGLNFRMPIDIDANIDDDGVGMPPRMTWVEYAGLRWEIQQAAGPGYDPIVTISGGNTITLDPGAGEHSVSFFATDDWLAETVDSPWITITGPDEGFESGNYSLALSFSPNPGATPRIGTVQIEDMFFNVIQPVEPPEVISINSLFDPRGFNFMFKALNGVTYELEHSTTMLPGSWMKLDDAVGERANPEMSFDTEFPDELPRGFYRIRSIPAE